MRNMKGDENTPLDKLLNRYNRTRNYVAQKLVEFNRCENEEPSKNIDSKKTKKQKGGFTSKRVSISRYAHHEQSPRWQEFLLMVEIIDCSPEELYSTLKYDPKIERYLRSNAGDVEVEKLRLLAGGYEFVYVEVKDTDVNKNKNGNVVGKKYMASSYRKDVKKIRVPDTYAILLKPQVTDCNCLNKYFCTSSSILKIVRMETVVEFPTPLQKGQYTEFSSSFDSPAPIPGYFLTRQSGFPTKIKHPLVRTNPQQVNVWDRADENCLITRTTVQLTDSNSEEWQILQHQVNQNPNGCNDWLKVPLC